MPVIADKIPGNGPGALASTMVRSTRSSSKVASIAAASQIVEAPAEAAMSSPQAASTPTTMASEAVQQSRCRSSMRATLLATIGVEARVMTTRIVRLALCISISRLVLQGQLGRRLLVRMAQLGMVTRALTSCGMNRTLIGADGGQIVYYRQMACPQTLTSSYRSSCTC